MRARLARYAAPLAGVCTGAAVWFFSGAPLASAEPIKYAEIVTPAKTEFEAAITAVLPFVGLVIGVLVGVMIVKRLAKAR